MNRNHLVLFIILLCLEGISQITQTVKGKITDKAVGIGLPGVVVRIKGDATSRCV